MSDCCNKITAEATATAESVTAEGVIITASSTATATGDTFEEAYLNAFIIAQNVAESQAQNEANLTNQIVNIIEKYYPSSTGPTGPAGQKGDAGTEGPTGPAGSGSSSTGPTGPTGQKGDNGTEGPTGQKGDAGSQGDKGDTGPEGPTGPAGSGGGGSEGPTGPTGQIGFAGQPGSASYDYSNFGNNFFDSSINNWFRTIATSYSGQYQTTVGLDGLIYVSQNYGNSWNSPSVTTPANQTFVSNAMSSNGQYQMIVYATEYYNPGAGGAIISTDFGSTWNTSNLLPERYSCVRMSSSGQHITVVGWQSGIYVSSDYGNTWTRPLSTTANIKCSGMSASGQIQVATGWNYDTYYVSNDYGVNWTIMPYASIPYANYNTVAVSSTGQYIYLCADYLDGVLYSTDYGLTWNMSLPLSNRNTIDISTDGTGQYLVAVNNTRVFYSKNFGVSWSESNLGQTFVQCCALSTNSQYMTVGTGGGGLIYESVVLGLVGPTGPGGIQGPTGPEGIQGQTGQIGFAGQPGNAGYDYSQFGKNIIQYTSAPVDTYKSGASSYSGQFQTVVSINGNIYVSTNSGISWTLNSSITGDEAFVSNTMSSNGQIQIVVSGASAVSGEGAVTISNNFGSTWSPLTSLTSSYPGRYSCVRMSSTGQYILVVSWLGPTVVSKDYGNTWSNVSAINYYSQCCGVSGTGQYMLALGWSGETYFSNNYGVTWRSYTLPLAQPTSIAISTTGQYMYICCDNDDKVSYSSNYGETWNTTLPFVGISFSSICTDGTGQYVVTVRAALVYYSTNFGVTFTIVPQQTVPPLQDISFKFCVLSTSSQYLILGRVQGQIYESVLTGIVGPTGQSAPQLTPLSGSYGNVSNIPKITVTNGYISNITTVPAKSFVIDHPIDENKYLVHACLEGPEAGVYYRGEAEITNNESVTITLPNYVSHIARNFTVQLTSIYDGKHKLYSSSRVEDNKFTVYGENGAFYWIVYGLRCEVNVEPNKKDANVNGSGPYKWIEN